MPKDRNPNHQLTLSQLCDDLPVLIAWARNENDEYVIIEVGDYYVQFTGHEGGIYAEAVSNDYLGEAPKAKELLSERDHLALVLAGWNEPGTYESDGEPHQNFWQEWPANVPCDDVAGELLRALVAVYMRGEGGEFKVFVANFKRPSRYDAVFG